LVIRDRGEFLKVVNSTNLERYLRKYAPNAALPETNAEKIRYAVVVPTIAEYDNLKKFLSSFLEQDKTYFTETLLLFVINNSFSSEPEIKENNRRSIEYLRGVMNSGIKINIGLVDASSPGRELPDKDAGVGLARKTGMDAVLKLFRDEEEGLLICTDADCIVADNYLTEIVNFFSGSNYNAAVINFEHQFDEESANDAVICYEIFLRYYVLGLKFSGSPFAFHTIGSAMACKSGAYMDIEGMNKRKAAEDFYFLEKLAKKYPVGNISSTTVYPSSRGSWRVPFGTGQRVNRFISGTHQEYVLYHPGCFRVLNDWHKIFFNNDIFNAGIYLKKAESISRNLYDFLIGQGFEADWNNITRNIKTSAQVMKQKIRWFDGFRTLKLVHHLRDNSFGNKSMFNAVDKLFRMLNFEPGISRDKEVPDREVQLKYLKLMRETDNK
jgi:hypothetical protein